MIGSLNIGGLDRRIVIQQSSGQDAVTGQPDETWSTYSTVWASKLSKRAKEKVQGDQPVSVGDEVFVIRYDSGVTEGMRISWNSNTYEITSIEEIGRQAGLTITAQRVN